MVVGPISTGKKGADSAVAEVVDVLVQEGGVEGRGGGTTTPGGPPFSPPTIAASSFSFVVACSWFREEVVGSVVCKGHGKTTASGEERSGEKTSDEDDDAEVGGGCRSRWTGISAFPARSTPSVSAAPVPSSLAFAGPSNTEASIFVFVFSSFSLPSWVLPSTPPPPPVVQANSRNGMGFKRRKFSILKHPSAETTKGPASNNLPSPDNSTRIRRRRLVLGMTNALPFRVEEETMEDGGGGGEAAEWYIVWVVEWWWWWW